MPRANTTGCGSRIPTSSSTPIYSAKYGKETRNFTVTPEHNWFAFDFKPKVRVQGRMVDSASGKRVEDSYVQGEVAATGAGGPFAEFAEKWTHVDWADPDADGHFEMKLAAGPARLTGGSQGYTAPEDNLEVDVAADGSTVARDILLSPMPKVRGTVTTSDGRPIAQAIVRFGGSELGHVQPVATDAEGRFELTPPWIPIDQETKAHLPKQSIVAFHPLEPLGGRAEISLDDPKSLDHVAVTLVPQEVKQLLASIDSQIGVRKKLADPVEQKKNEERSLVGKPAPELDGVTWLNTDKPQMTLADFRGKYVLLDFWTTWCGPCHADFPGVRLLHDLYKDKGFVIIGVHDNSMPLAAIQADVKKESLDFSHRGGSRRWPHSGAVQGARHLGLSQLRAHRARRQRGARRGHHAGTVAARVHDRNRARSAARSRAHALAPQSFSAP